MAKELSVQLSLASELTNIQLVELPAEILAQIESTDASKPVLEIKSQSGTAGFASICTSEETYKVVVHHTSNSMYIVEPSEESGLTAVSVSGAILEMLPVATLEAESTIQQTLQNKLTNWTVSQGFHKMKQISKTDVYSDIPFSKEQIDNVWARTCAWEDDATCFIPEPQALLAVWKTILTAATAENIHFNKDEEVQHKRQTLKAAIMDDDIPPGLFEAILRQIETEKKEDGAEFVKWIGMVMLQSAAEWNRREFMERWLELVPDVWMEKATLERLGDAANMSDPTVVKAKLISSGDSNSKTTTTGSRKWHERFKKA